MYHHPTVSRALVQARQQDELRSAANRRLAAEAKSASGTAVGAPALRVTRPGRVPQLRKMLTRLLPA
jgi:hypothetical protein